MDEIVFKWWSDKHRLGMTETGEVYSWDGKVLSGMKKEAFRGSLIYRLHGSSRRISRKQFAATCRECRMVIERDLPF